MQERWATFDCYCTLIDWQAGLRAVFEQLWPRADTARLVSRYHAVEPLIQDSQSMAYREVGARTLRAISAMEDLPLAASDAYAISDMLPHWRVFPEVPGALDQLRRDGWRLAILSNTDPDLLAASIASMGVPIDMSITAAEAGSYKPAPGHWQRFFELSGAERDRHAHVAASPFHDLMAAQRLGLPAVWINRLGEQSEFPRAAELTDLAPLPPTLARLVPGG
jgi:2-haloacid dehalogenase